MNFLLLFDIDGTLLSIPKKGMQIVSESLNEQFQRSMELPHKSFSGQTDWQIFRETLAHHGFDLSESENEWKKFKEIYGSKFEELISINDVKVHNGAIETTQNLSKITHVQLGLLTGNIKMTAYKKLRLIGIDQQFENGAFGDDHWKREWLGSIAIERFLSKNNSERSKVVIIGDTPRDVDVAKYIGAVSIGVTNGAYSRDDLHNHGADFIVSELQSIPEILNQIRS